MEPIREHKRLEKHLLKLVALRDEDAFRYFYDKYRPKVYTCALRISKSREFAEDIVHEVFLKFWSLNDPERIANVEAFLRVVTRNHTLELLRKRILEYEITNELVKETNEIDNSTDNWINLNETNRSLQEAVMLLPPQQRTVFQLCKEDGLKYTEAAEKLKLSPLTVKTHMQLALRFLRSYLRHAGVMALIAVLIK